QGCGQECAGWIASHPFSPANKDSNATRLNRLMLKPAFLVFGETECGRVATLWVLLQTLEANRIDISINPGVPVDRLERLAFQNHPNGFIGGAASERRMSGDQLIKHRPKSVDIRGIR